MSYIESELEALEREQESIDLKAGALEKKLRSVMGGVIDSKFDYQKSILCYTTNWHNWFFFRSRWNRRTITVAMVHSSQ